ncbi:MAG TPA: DUF2202 domain-containing protein [Bacteroidetes bacterium]|nr:DUF2202 domain-containing protein [Bacteroidota bacterium]
MKHLIIPLLLAGTLFSANGQEKQTTKNQAAVPPCLQPQNTGQTASLSREEARSLILLREEEKLARDVYRFFHSRHSWRPFANIAGSEQAHMDAILYLLERYDLEDPAAHTSEGEFINRQWKTLYMELTARGKDDPLEALRAAALIEETDIADLQEALDGFAENPDVIRVYANLLRASKNHLRTFVRLLEWRNETYSPVILSAEEFHRIMEG